MSDKIFMSEILTTDELKDFGIIANASIRTKEFYRIQKIISDIYLKTKEAIKLSKGPFYAEIYDERGKLIASCANSVVEDKCSICHAEINAIMEAHKKIGHYSLANRNLTIYINAEPCMMCLGAIMWSGIRTVVFGVQSKDVEKITGFDEGFKPDWINEFKKRGIKVFGNIESEAGKEILKDYVLSGKEIYKPRR